MQYLALFVLTFAALASAKPSGWGLGGTVLVPPSAHAVVSGPAWGWQGAGAWGGWAGHGVGSVALGPHGVAVQGPKTVPVVVAGPAGKIVADGLYGVPHHW